MFTFNVSWCFSGLEAPATLVMATGGQCPPHTTCLYRKVFSLRPETPSSFSSPWEETEAKFKAIPTPQPHRDRVKNNV